MYLPTGTVTFLFSDVEGSTQRWQAYPEAMRAALARHDELARAAVSRHGGYVFKMVGDGFCAAFASPQEALGAAIDVQRALAKEDFSAVGGLRARMGLHTGAAEERDADYFGPAVNRVARLMSVGSGGQVLLSNITYELVRDDPREDVAFADLGPHRLKDLAHPEHVWQVNIQDLPSDFPPLRSLDAFPNNLPTHVTSFHGREQDLEELKGHLAEHRLVTLFGAGGVGKTRLAAQAGAELLERFPDGVWIADLAPITDPDSVSSVVAKAVGIGSAQGRGLDEAISQALREKELLLVLDNCEHLLDTAAVLADTIHRNCPSVRILATSRQALGLAGEKVVRLSSLAVPDKLTSVTSATALQFGAVALFANRASLVDRSFRLTDGNAAIVTDVCRRLDGIPLAIELAAARVRVLTLSNLAQHLDERFKILTGGSRTALRRQQTLSAMIDWSYDLLSTEEQELFNHLSIFAGSFTLEAATFVCAGDGVEEIDVLDIITSLSDKSLLVPDTSGSQERYRLLESTRQYALEKLTASGRRDGVTRRHGEYFAQLAQRAGEDFGAMPLGEWLSRLEPEVENVRATLEWALGRGNSVALGGGIASALEMFWWHGGFEGEGRRWIELALERMDENTNADISGRLRHSLLLLTSRVLYS
jgi:predicted ATPase/class 3 adenylate cyclase